MARKFLTAIDLAKNELQNAVLQVLAGDPSTPVAGQMYYNSTSQRPFFRTASAFIDLTARANHTGTQAWSTLTATPTTLAGYGISDATPSSHVGSGGTAHAEVIAGGASGFMSGADKTKLNGIATGATANSSDATLLNRANHTGTQLASTISDFDTQVRTSRLDQMAAPTADVSLNTRKLTNLGAPTADSDAATKKYVDDSVAGLSWKDEVRVATTTSGTLASSFANGQTVDGVTLVTGDRILIKDQSTASQNGIYVVNASGAPNRAPDANTSTEIQGSAVYVAAGTTNGGTRWVNNTTGTITLDTTGLTFVQFGGGNSYTAGNGLTLTGNDFNVGAGTGISVSADAVAVDTAVVVRKFTQLIGNNSSTSIAVTHNLGNQWVIAQAYEVATSAQIECDIIASDSNTTTFVFALAPASNAIRVVIQG